MRWSWAVLVVAGCVGAENKNYVEDAGPADAGPADAGVVDAGPQDAGRPCDAECFRADYPCHRWTCRAGGGCDYTNEPTNAPCRAYLGVEGTCDPGQGNCVATCGYPSYRCCESAPKCASNLTCWNNVCRDCDGGRCDAGSF